VVEKFSCLASCSCTASTSLRTRADPKSSSPCTDRLPGRPAVHSFHSCGMVVIVLESMFCGRGDATGVVTAAARVAGTGDGEGGKSTEGEGDARPKRKDAAAVVMDEVGVALVLCAAVEEWSVRETRPSSRSLSFDSML
jgi:hypothetical protein